MSKYADQVVLFYAALIGAFSGGRIKPPDAFAQAKAFIAEAKKQVPDLFKS